MILYSDLKICFWSRTVFFIFHPTNYNQGSLIFLFVEEGGWKDVEAIIGTFSVICMGHRAGRAICLTDSHWDSATSYVS